MKRDKEITGLFIICCVFQVLYFDFFVETARPFVFIQGLHLWESTVLPYLDICVLCLPMFMLVLLFSDSYSFYMENYGRLLLIRNCSVNKRILRIYLDLSIWLLALLGIQFLCNILFDFSYFKNNIPLLIKGGIAYYFVNLFVIILEVCICSWMNDNLVQIFLDLYIFVSCFTCYYFKGKIVYTICMPGQILWLKKMCEAGKLSYLQNEIIIPMLVMGSLYAVTSIHCKKKDIF